MMTVPDTALQDRIRSQKSQLQKTSYLVVSKNIKQRKNQVGACWIGFIDSVIGWLIQYNPRARFVAP